MKYLYPPVRIKDESLQQVLAAADVAEVVGDFVTLKRRGRNLIACCPFHNEKTPSFNVNPERGIYKCFGCGKGGDTVQFVMEIEGLTFSQAIEYLAKRYSINLEYDQGSYDQDSDSAKEREALMVALQYAQGWYRKQLTDSEAGKTVALPYLKERGILPVTQEEFGVGWAPETSDAFTKQALAQGYKADVLEAAGLSLRRDDGSLYDRFRGRVMFPIYTPSGRVVGFGGRILGKDPKLAKYVNSPESVVYQKSRILYGLWQSRKDIRQADQVFLTEGYLDVIALHQAGIPRAVASSGTSLTQEQAHLITRYTENVTVLFDGDAAGVKAALRGIDILLEEGLAVRVLNLPDGHDPDSYLKAYGSEAFLNYVKKEERDFVSFKAKILLEEAGNDPFKRAGVATEVVRTISLMPDRMKQDVLLREAARLLEVTEEVLIAEAARMDKARILERQKQADREKRRETSQQGFPAPPKLDLPPGILPPDSLPTLLPPDDFEVDPFGPDINDFGPTPPPISEKESKDESETPLSEGDSFDTILGRETLLTHHQQIELQEVEGIRLILNYGQLPLNQGQTILTHLLAEYEHLPFRTFPAKATLNEIIELQKLGINVEAHHLLQSRDIAVRRFAQSLVMPRETTSYKSDKVWGSNVGSGDIGPDYSKNIFKHLCLLAIRILRQTLSDCYTAINKSNDTEKQHELYVEFLRVREVERRIRKDAGFDEEALY